MRNPHPNRLAFREALYHAAMAAGVEAAFPTKSNNYVRFGSLTRGSDIGVSATQTGSRVTLNNRGADAQAIFNSLREKRQLIDKAVACDLDWNDENSDRKKTVVRASILGGYLSDRSSWADQHAQIVKTVQAFQRTFSLYL
jgi:Domain of unknown function (DUF4268)